MANDISIDADFVINEQPDIQADFVINEQPDIQADLHINFSPDVSNLVTREELAEDLAEKQDVLTAGDNIQIEDNVISATDTTYTAGEGISIVNNVISNTQTSAEWGNIEGDIAEQTDLIDLIDTKIDIEATARENNDLLLQNGINTLNNDLTAEISNRGTADGILQDNIDTLSDTVTSNYNTLDGKIGNNKTAIDNHIADKTNPHEVTKSQVGLGNVDNTSDLNKPISTATQNALNTKVSNTREINGYALSSDITLTASDVGALPDTTTIGNGTLTIQKNGSTIDSFGANDTGNTTVNITVPTDTSDLTNNAGYIKGINSTDVTTALGYTPYNSTNPAGYTDNVGTVTSVNNAQPDSNGNVTLSIPAAQVNSDWNASSGVSKILNKPTLSTVATTGNYNDLTNKPTIPTNVSAFTNDAKYIQNTATGVYGLTIEGTASNNVSSINIGKNSLVGGGFCTVVGNDATCTGGDAVTIGFNATSADSSIAIGTFAKATGISSIQIGNGTNSTNRTCQIGDYRILDGAGKIPNDRIPSNIARTSDLATVATSGSYNDLSDKPTIPAAQVNSDWAETDTSSKAYIENKPTLSTVATTGDYDDLLNKPTLFSGDYNDLTNKPSLSTVATTGDYNDLSNKPTIPTVNNATLTITQGGTTKGTFTANAGTDVTIDLDAGGGSSTDVQINGTSVTSGGVADIVTEGVYDASSNKIATMSDVPAAQVQANWNETDNTSKAYIKNKPTIPSTSNFVTTYTAQNISARKTFVGEKAIYFKQSASTNKLGFTLYNSSNTEVGGLEYNPSSNILALNAPKTGNTLLGFRYWSGNNIIVPKPSSSADYYLPLSFKNGSSTVTTNSSGVADLSNLIPTIATSVSASSTNAETVGAKLFYDTVGDIETLLSEV